MELLGDLPVKSYLPVLITVGFSAVGVLGDYLLKLASAQISR